MEMVWEVISCDASLWNYSYINAERLPVRKELYLKAGGDRSSHCNPRRFINTWIKNIRIIPAYGLL